MQQQLLAAQEEPARTQLTGTAGGGPGHRDGHRRRRADRAGDRPDRYRPLRPRGVGRPRAGRDSATANRAAAQLQQQAMGPLAEGPRRGRAQPARDLGRLVYEGVVQDLIDELGRLPGVGPKSAQRIAFHLLAADPVDVRRLVTAPDRGQGQGPVLPHLRQRRRGGAVPDLPRPAPRPDGHLRGRGAQGRRRGRADPRVPRPLPRARRGDQPDRGHRAGRPADQGAVDPAGRWRWSPS